MTARPPQALAMSGVVLITVVSLGTPVLLLAARADRRLTVLSAVGRVVGGAEDHATGACQ